MKKISKKQIILGLLVLLVLEIGFFLSNDKEKIAIDEYNFKQLEKAKVIMDNKTKDNYPLYGLNEFNNKYNMDIKPIRNCYYISNGNKGDKFIFGFKLESIIYRIKYLSGYYVYPKYDLPIRPLCTGLGSGKCIEDIGYIDFIKTISNPCQD